LLFARLVISSERKTVRGEEIEQEAEHEKGSDDVNYQERGPTVKSL